MITYKYLYERREKKGDEMGVWRFITNGGLIKKWSFGIRRLWV